MRIRTGNELYFIAGFLDEWHYRPSEINKNVKEEATFVVLEGDRIFPVYYDDLCFDEAKWYGFTKKEFIEAKKRIAEMEGE